MLFPEGLRTPIIQALGPKYFSSRSIWDLIPHYWSPWTLRVYVAHVRGHLEVIYKF